MTRAQYEAIQLIATEAERIRADALNIRPGTMAALIKRNWIEISNGFAWVTATGWQAVETI